MSRRVLLVGALVASILWAGCTTAHQSTGFTYTPEELRDGHSQGIPPPEAGGYPHFYEWMNQDTNNTYLGVVLEVPEVTEFDILVDKVGAFRDWKVLWNLNLGIRNVTHAGISSPSGGGTGVSTTCSAEMLRLEECRTKSSVEDARGFVSGTLQPGVFTWVSPAFGAEAASLWIQGWFDKPIEVLGTFEGRTSLHLAEADLQGKDASFQTTITSDVPVFFNLRTFRSSFDGPVNITTPDAERSFEREGFGWTDEQGRHARHSPHVFGPAGTYRIEAYGGPIDGEKPPLLLVGAIERPGFILELDDEAGGAPW